MNLQILGGRRFLLCIGSGVITAVLQWFGKLDAAGVAYVTVIGSTVGAFIAANVIESTRNTASGRPTKEPTE
jgi:hypothetical protein